MRTLLLTIPIVLLLGFAFPPGLIVCRTVGPHSGDGATRHATTICVRRIGPDSGAR